jgi:protease IV
MKRIFKFLVAHTLVAVLSSLISLFVLFLVVIGILAMIGQNQKGFPSEAVLHFDLSMNLMDTPQHLTFGDLVAQLSDDSAVPQHHLMDLIDTLKRAAGDRRVKAVVLQGGFVPMGYGCSYPVLDELRQALLAFRESGKPVLAWGVYPGVRELYVMSVADSISLNASGGIELPGLYGEPMFYADALEKFGIGVQAIRVGEYKSGVEPFTRRDLSDEAREEYQLLLDTLWGRIRDGIAEAREIDPVVLKAALEKSPMMMPEEAKALGLVDEVITHVEWNARLADLVGGMDENGDYPAIHLTDYILEKDRFLTPPSGEGIAVVYAEGEIVGGYGGKTEVGADRIIADLRAARANPEIRGIVLRVNSPGGSGVASRIIQDELLAIREAEIPLVVSMGGYAASGGYYLAQSADHIFAHPHTVTGSIGIYGLMFHIGEGAGKLGLTFDGIKTGEHSDLLSVSTPKRDVHLRILQDYIETFYRQWIVEGSEFRGMEPAAFEKAARGRAWSGHHAGGLGLVDSAGGLQEAVAHAAMMAELDSWSIWEYPRKLSPEEALVQALNLQAHVSAQGNPVAIQAREWMKSAQRTLDRFQDPFGAYALSPFTYR